MVVGCRVVIIVVTGWMHIRMRVPCCRNVRAFIVLPVTANRHSHRRQKNAITEKFIIIIIIIFVLFTFLREQAT